MRHRITIDQLLSVASMVAILGRENSIRQVASELVLVWSCSSGRDYEVNAPMCTTIKSESVGGLEYINRGDCNDTIDENRPIRV